MKKERLPDFSRMKRVKGPKISPDDIHPANVKVRITTYISEDIYRWLKRLADGTGTPYQILLNQKLRQVFDVEDPEKIEARLKKLEDEIKKMKAA